MSHQVGRRYVDGELIPVQRLKCRHCGKTFRVLPEWAIPYKHYGAGRVEAAIDRVRAGGSVREAARRGRVDRAVVRRWWRWWRRLREWLETAELVVWLHRPGWLRELLRAFPHWRRRAQCGRG
jgi:transposase-like protein